MSDSLPQTMILPPPSANGVSGVPTININLSERDSAATGDARRRSRLEGSLRGVNLPQGSQYYLFANGYSTIDGLTLSREAIDEDLEGLRNWACLLHPRPDFHQYSDYYKGGSKRAEYKKIRKTLRATQHIPTLIYISGHTETTESPNNQLVYVAADHLPTVPKLLPYETMRTLLLENPSPAPLLLITEVCFCYNFLELPYMLECDGNEVRWTRTEHSNVFDEDSSVLVHFAATSPDERAISFKNGAVFTRAFYNIDPRGAKSLGGIAKELQEKVNSILSDDREMRTQHPKIYCSKKIDDPHFFKALGFHSPPDSDSSAGGDSDSNA